MKAAWKGLLVHARCSARPILSRLGDPRWQAHATTWVVSCAVALSLYGLVGRISADLPRLEVALTQDQFADQDALANSREEVKAINATLKSLTDQRDRANVTLQAASSSFETARSAFDEWLALHKAPATNKPDGDLLAHSRELEQLKARERQAESALEEIDDQLRAAREELRQHREAENKILRDADEALKSAAWRQELRVFLARLALTLPLCVVAGYLARRFRQGRAGPLWRGLALFAGLCLVTELLPYVPTLGGYVPLAAGLLCATLGGHWLSDAMRRRAESSATSPSTLRLERSRQVLAQERALRKLAARTCPACEGSIPDGGIQELNFCVHCGTTLNTHCSYCESRHSAFFSFCPDCGTSQRSAYGSPKPSAISNSASRASIAAASSSASWS